MTASFVTMLRLQTGLYSIARRFIDPHPAPPSSPTLRWRADAFEGSVHVLLEAAVAGVKEQTPRFVAPAERRQTQRAVETRLRWEQPAVTLRFEDFEETERLRRLAVSVRGDCCPELRRRRVVLSRCQAVFEKPRTRRRRLAVDGTAIPGGARDALRQIRALKGFEHGGKREVERRAHERSGKPPAGHDQR
jgi:hypothetical protein